MKSKTTTVTSEPTVTRETLDATPERVLTFLLALGTVLAIRRALERVGYTQKDHQQGWDLLHAASGYSAPKPIGIEVDARVRDAAVELDNWDEDGFRVVRASLSRLHPDQAAFVLEGLEASQGPAAVLGVKTLLDRLDTLEDGASRKATRKQDHAALETLATRGITRAERKRLRALVETAESSPDLGDDPVAAHTETDAKHLADLVALRVWFEDWSEMAKTAVKRRDYLIRMGFAKRKSPKRSGDARTGDAADAGATTAAGTKQPATATA